MARPHATIFIANDVSDFQVSAIPCTAKAACIFAAEHTNNITKNNPLERNTIQPSCSTLLSMIASTSSGGHVVAQNQKSAHHLKSAHLADLYVWESMHLRKIRWYYSLLPRCSRAARTTIAPQDCSFLLSSSPLALPGMHRFWGMKN